MAMNNGLCRAAVAGMWIVFFPLTQIQAAETDIVPSAIEQEIGLYDTVIPISTRNKQSVKTSPENVTIITKKEIARMPVHSLSDVLAYVGGVSMDTRTGFSHAAAYGMHSPDSRHVRVMVDGIELNNEISGQAAINAIPVSNVDRIEIVKGALSSRWGSALGGVINVITKEPEASVIPHGQVTGGLSEYKGRYSSADVSGGAKGFTSAISGGYTQAGGIRNYDDMLQRYGTAHMCYDYGDTARLTTLAGYADSNESEGPYPNQAWFKRKFYERHVKVQGDYMPSDRAKFSLSGSLLGQNARSFDDSGGRSEFHDLNSSIAGESTFTFREADTLVNGVEVSRDSLEALTMPAHYSMNAQGAYSNYTLVQGPVAVSGGLRYDHHSDFDDQVSPSVGIVYELPYVPRTRVRASIARGYKAPPLAWLYYDDGVFKPNPDLKPERAWVKEVGVEQRIWQPVWAKVNLFQSDIADFIDAETGSFPFAMRNKKKYRQQGLEMEIRYDVMKYFYTTASSAFSDLEDTTSGQNDYASALARNDCKVGIHFHDFHGFNAALFGNYVRFRSPGYLRHESKLVWDCKVSQKIEVWRSVSTELFFSVHNIGNSAFWHDEYYPHVPRYVEAGVTVRF